MTKAEGRLVAWSVLASVVLTLLSITHQSTGFLSCAWEFCGETPAWGWPWAFILDSPIVTETLIGRPSIQDWIYAGPFLKDVIFYELCLVIPYLVWRAFGITKKHG